MARPLQPHSDVQGMRGNTVRWERPELVLLLGLCRYPETSDTDTEYWKGREEGIRADLATAWLQEGGWHCGPALPSCVSALRITKALTRVTVISPSYWDGYHSLSSQSLECPARQERLFAPRNSRGDKALGNKQCSCT